MSRRRKQLPQEPVPARIESLTHEGRGVTHIDGKAVFVDGALPGEDVMFRYTRRKRAYDEGTTVEVLQASPDRVRPRCAHFGVCGGCSMQHLATDAQIRAKQQVLLDDLTRIGGVEPETVLPPLTGPVWGYRRKARLGVKDVIKKGRVLVGFRERRSPYLAELERCEVLDSRVGPYLGELGRLIEGLHARGRIAQIEVALGDETGVLVFRNLDPLGEADRGALLAFGRAHGLRIYLQPGGPDTVQPLEGESTALNYALPAHQVEIAFEPTDFTQVNADINRAMVDRALELLEPDAGDRILELFAGLGNFTLPLARRVARVVAVEGEAGLVARAEENARCNGVDNVEHHVADLAAEVEGLPWLRGRTYDRVLLDPPRSGAAAVLASVASTGAKRLVYVSCNPATLARDAAELVQRHGFRLRCAGVMDMFPHTGHVESIAAFERCTPHPFGKYGAPALTACAPSLQ